MTNPLPELLPCFYCGGETQVSRFLIPSSGDFIECETCNYKSSSLFKTRETAIEAHNHIYKCIDEAFLRIARKEDYWKRNEGI